MSLSRNDRALLAAVWRWAREAGWQADVYPGAWRSRDGEVRVLFEFDELRVQWLGPRFRHPRTAWIPVATLGQALDVLVALSVLPPAFASPHRLGREEMVRARQALRAALDAQVAAGP